MAGYIYIEIDWPEMAHILMWVCPVIRTVAVNTAARDDAKIIALRWDVRD